MCPAPQAERFMTGLDGSLDNNTDESIVYAENNGDD